jgi:hypothetical protein
MLSINIRHIGQDLGSFAFGLHGESATLDHPRHFKESN